MPKAAETAPHPAAPLMDQAAAMELTWLRPLGTFGVAMADAWADLLAETASFLAGRLRQNARTLHAILHSRSPAELQAAQADYVQQVLDEYRDEAARIITLSEGAMRAATAPTPH